MLMQIGPLNLHNAALKLTAGAPAQLLKAGETADCVCGTFKRRQKLTGQLPAWTQKAGAGFRRAGQDDYGQLL